jgi:hypothetical protein
MLWSLLAATVLSIAHHIFYQYLDDREVPTADFFAHFSQQEVNIAAGTAFAFLTQSCLAYALSVAFIQVFWRTVKHGGDSERFDLGHMDVAFSATGNLFSFFSISVWRFYPLLLIIAAIAW